MLGFVPSDLRLLARFVTMSLKDRVLGSGLGVLWALLGPSLMLGVFTFVFGFVFKAKLPGAETSLSYVIWLISGYGPWLAINEGLTAGTGAVVGNAALVKNLSFRSELLPLAAVVAALVPLLVSVTYLAALLAVEGVAPSLPWLAVPGVLLLQVLFVGGLATLLAAINVFLRDIALALPNLLLVLLFATPIFYPIDTFPPYLRRFAAWNPFYLIAEGYRAPLLRSQWPGPTELVALAAVTAVSLGGGLFVFRRLKPLFDSRL